MSIVSAGLPGVSTKQLREEYTDLILKQKGLCSWVGTSPFCKGRCSIGFYSLHRSKWPIAGSATFGKACTSGKKALCCKNELLSMRRWSGLWGSNDSTTEMASKYIAEGRYGQEARREIIGDQCNQYKTVDYF